MVGLDDHVPLLPSVWSESPKRLHPTQLTGCLDESQLATWSYSQMSLFVGEVMRLAMCHSTKKHGARASEAVLVLDGLLVDEDRVRRRSLRELPSLV